jgi:hypothetical protein
VTQRDKYILSVLPVIGLIVVFWLMVLGPKRNELRDLDKRVGQSQQAVQAAQQEAQQFARDRLDFPRDYATVVRLGKAAPTDPNVPSLLVQLERAADLAGVDFRKISLAAKGGSTSSGGAAAAPPPSTPPPSPSGGSTSSGTQSSGSESTSQTGSSASGTTGPAGSSSSSAAAAPADAVVTAEQPIGTVVGPAQLPIMRFQLRFQGSFFKLADFVHNVRSLVERQGRKLLVSGRLLTIDAIAFSEGDAGFPQVKANIAATAYLVPASQGLLAGATPQGPGGATASTPTPVANPTGSTAPSAVVTAP